jgi:hypothetical protein
MLSRGDRAWWLPALRRARCLGCAADGAPEAGGDPWAGLAVGERGRAGASALARYGRERRAREVRIRCRHPVLGGLLLAVSDEPASITAWRRGGEGEQRLGRRLDALVETGRVEALHDRARPGSRANLDHLVVGPSGVFVIDAKRYRGKVERRRVGTRLRAAPDRLFVDGRDRSHLLAAVERQAEDVAGALLHLHAAPALAVLPVLCFLDADRPAMGTAGLFGRVHVTGPRGLERLVCREGPVGHSQRLSLARRLSAAFPPTHPGLQAVP